MWPGRLLLLALLAVDWASDPYQGTCPYSEELSSTEAYSASADYREEIRQELAAAAAPAALPAPLSAPAPDDGAPPPPAAAPRNGHAIALLYLHTPLLC